MPAHGSGSGKRKELLTTRAIIKSDSWFAPVTWGDYVGDGEQSARGEWEFFCARCFRPCGGTDRRGYSWYREPSGRVAGSENGRARLDAGQPPWDL